MALSGKTISPDFIVERLHNDYGFSEIYPVDIYEYIWDVVGLIGAGAAYTDEVATVEVTDYKGKLPVNFYDMNEGGVREKVTWVPLSEMSDKFYKTDNKNPQQTTLFPVDTDPATGEYYHTAVPPEEYPDYYRYKINNGYIWTVFQQITLEVAYKAFPIDVEFGIPVVPDDPQYLRAVTAYCAKMIGFKEYLKDNLSERKYDRLEQEYLFAAGAARNKALMPDPGKMEKLRNIWKSPLPYYDHYESGFRHLGGREVQ